MTPEKARQVAMGAIGLRCLGPDKDGFFEASLGVGTQGVRGLSRNANAAIAYCLEAAAAVYLEAARRDKDAGDPPEPP